MPTTEDVMAACLDVSAEALKCLNTANTAIATAIETKEEATRIAIEEANKLGDTCVKLTGNQIIGGLKTFQGNANTHPIKIKCPWCDITTFEHSHQQNFLTFTDVNDKPYCSIRASSMTNMLRVGLHLWPWDILDESGNAIPGNIGNSLFYRRTWEPRTNTMIDTFHSENPKLTSLGTGFFLWKDIFAANSQISTSDARSKSNVAPYPDELLDAWQDVNLCQFQFNDAVEKKGEQARIHGGMIAQQILEAFHNHSLDPTRYAFFCHDAWQAEPDEVDENGEVISKGREAGDAYSLRYTEALCIEAAYQRRRADRLEQELADIKERLSALESK